MCLAKEWVTLEPVGIIEIRLSVKPKFRLGEVLDYFVDKTIDLFQVAVVDILVKSI